MPLTCDFGLWANSVLSKCTPRTSQHISKSQNVTAIFKGFRSTAEGGSFDRNCKPEWGKNHFMPWPIKAKSTRIKQCRAGMSPDPPPPVSSHETWSQLHVLGEKMKPWHFFEEQSLRERLEGIPGGEQQQHPGDKRSFKLLREQTPEEGANHNY